MRHRIPVVMFRRRLDLGGALGREGLPRLSTKFRRIERCFSVFSDRIWSGKNLRFIAFHSFIIRPRTQTRNCDFLSVNLDELHLWIDMKFVNIPAVPLPLHQERERELIYPKPTSNFRGGCVEMASSHFHIFWKVLLNFFLFQVWLLMTRSWKYSSQWILGCGVRRADSGKCIWNMYLIAKLTTP